MSTTGLITAEGGATTARSGFGMTDLVKTVNDANLSALAKLTAIKAAGSTISIANMFDMQLIMNRLSQYSEMTSAVVSAANQAISGMARNIK